MGAPEFGNDEVKDKDMLTFLKHIQPLRLWDGNVTGCYLDFKDQDEKTT